jgi:4-hydroxybenzoate polyprenyltransferase
MATFRTLLVLGRVSNLPTVWSNCLAGWLLGGGGDWYRFLGEWPRLVLVCLGGTFLYVAGMYLNDAFDAQWDQQRRPERPIPSGAITLPEVWQWGLIWMALGLACLALLGRTTALLALMLAGCIFVYDAIHKIFAFAPVLMAACRLLLVLAAASAAAEGITGYAIWCALVLASYVVGLSFLARAESPVVAVRYWPCLFLGAPVLLALIVNQGAWQLRGVLLAGVLVVWLLHCLRFSYWSEQRNVGLSVAGLLAGIALVDLLAVGGEPELFGLGFGLFFVLALLGQRLVPAT